MNDTRYEKRFYREWVAPAGLVRFHVSLKESDLLIAAERDLGDEALGALQAVRSEIERYIILHPEFGNALEPLHVEKEAPGVIRNMAKAASACGVGPMAGVAGAVAEKVGRTLIGSTREVVVENGGDIFALLKRSMRMALYSGENKPVIPLRLSACPEGTGIASSSAFIGPSLSFGKADVCTVIADNASLADAAATALCNRIKGSSDLRRAVQQALEIEGVKGAVAVLDGETALGGEGVSLARP